ncbi:tRNA (adenosine(37)-N6)-dimethylallyltransferase MiaA [Desulfovibrio cuneatus]|uniref:tRNA (adenosine(37)-N6)-dimethylallyltransferase MiaA n=1 Tax=Desulfovibrio cuneatus TaxID=159728 RepID=UPI0003F7C3B1
MMTQSAPSSSSALLVPCLLGPTGAGKTSLALELARRWPVSIINADSRQVYHDFPIITAQPTAEEQAACPHFLYGFLESQGKISAGAYARMARERILEEAAKGRLPVLVGGTGLYIQTLFDGIAPIPPVSPAIAAHWQVRCKEEGSHALHAELATVDPDYAAKIHPNDRQRITRGLEVWQATGKPLSWWHSQHVRPTDFTPVKIGLTLPLAELEPILEKRITLMLEAGALDEAKNALTLCDDPEAPGWSGIGCRELYDHIIGHTTLEECRALWLKNTRAYAKRQMTWFRREEDVRWFAPGQVEAAVMYAANCLAAAEKGNG